MSDVRPWPLVAAIALPALAGCRRDKAPAPVAPKAPSSSPVAAASAGGLRDGSAPDAGGGPTRRAFRGKGFVLAIESRGKTVRAMFEHAGVFELQGELKDATHFSVRDVHAPKEGKAMTILGEWSPDGSTLTATLTTPDKEKPLELRANLGPFEASLTTFTTDIQGWLGRGFIRMKVTREGASLRGVYRYAKSAEDIKLTGTVAERDGSFELTESVHGVVTGRFAGVFASLFGALATWSSPDGSRSFPIDLEPGNGGYPETVDLGGGLSLYPQETVHQSDGCAIDIVLPQLRGANDRTKQTALNALLRGDREKAFACDAPVPDAPTGSFQDVGYTLLTKKKGRFVSLSQSQFYYTAGAAHPNGDATCIVLDTKTVTALRMVDELTGTGRAELGARVTRMLQGDGPKLTEQMYNSDDIEIGPNTNLCLTDTEIQVAFERYEIAPYVMGAPGVSFAKADVRSLFEKNDVMDALFAQ